MFLEARKFGYSIKKVFSEICVEIILYGLIITKKHFLTAVSPDVFFVFVLSTTNGHLMSAQFLK